MLLQASLHPTSLTAAAVADSAQEVTLAAVQHCMTCMADLNVSYVAADRAVTVICIVCLKTLKH